MNHQARQFDNKKGTLQRPCKPVPACLARWPEKGQAITTADHPIIANDFLYFTYKNSNKQTQTDANNNTTAYSYDALNRQTQTTYADSATETYSYDANGNRTGLTDAKGQRFSYVYDALNRETARNYPLPAIATGDDIQSITTTYDANSNPLTITETYSGATGTRLTTKTYDKFDRLLTVNDAFNELIKYGYDANGNRTRLTDPDNS